MSFVAFPKSLTDPNAPGGFRLDNISREELVSAAQLTSVPIEARGTVSDHRYVMPDKGTVEGMLSPLIPIYTPKGIDGVKDQVAQIVRHLKAGVILTCVFGFDTIDLELTEAARTLSPADGFALRVRLKLQEVRQIVTESITIPAASLRRRVRRQAARSKKEEALRRQETAESTFKHTPAQGAIVVSDRETIAQPFDPGPGLGTPNS